MGIEGDVPRRATMTDVAKLAGVSLKTVSRVINEVPTVDPDLAARVHQAAENLGFRPNFAAALLRSGDRTATIGLLVKDLGNEFYATIASAVAGVANTRGFQLITTHSGENPEDEMAAVKDLCRRRVDGLLIVPTGGDHAALKKEIELGIPMVFLDREPMNLEADCVLLDNFAGAYAGARKLLNEGHTSIAVLVDTLNMATMGRRLEGVRKAFEDYGVPFDSSLVFYDVSNPEQARSRVERLILGLNPPTAIFCGNNRSAIGALMALSATGRDVALVAFDDFYLSQLMPRSFTIIRYDNQALGSVGAELLFRRIDGDTSGPQTVVLPTELCQRGIDLSAQAKPMEIL